ncbi:MAG: hypothetical protein Q9227_003188 [Pyrenula ochraceoflavens]
MATTVPSLQSLLSRTTLDDHEEVLKAANGALKTSKNDSEAQHARVVALLKLDRYDDAVRVFEEAGDALKQKAGLEYAYGLYKTGRLKEAREAASHVEGQGARFVEAQAAYRGEDFEVARSIFREAEARSRRDANLGEEFKANMGAVEAQILWRGRGEAMEELRTKKAKREELETFELAYNAACRSIAQGNLQQAEVLLKRAKELCKHSAGLAEEDKQAELLPISVQQLYVFVRLGKTKEAEEIMTEIEVDQIPDLSTRSIAKHNLLSGSTKPSNPFVAHKLLNSTPSPPQSDALFNFQSQTATANSYTVDLHAFKHDGVTRSTTARLQNPKLSPTDPSQTVPSVFHAAAIARSDTSKAAIKKIYQEIKHRPYNVGLVLTLVQLQVLNGHYASATTSLESFLARVSQLSPENLPQSFPPGQDPDDVRYNPGLIGLLVALYKHQNRTRQIKSELAEAAIHWTQKFEDQETPSEDNSMSNAPSNRPVPPLNLLLAAGSALSTSDFDFDRDAAKEIFTAARSAYPNNRAATAGYIAAHATSSSTKDNISSDLVSQLPPLSPLISNIDTTALLAQGIPNPPISAERTAKLKRKAGAGSADAPKKKRMRKNRLPKDYVEGKVMDPERWLPARERSGWRPPKKGKKGRGGGDRGGAQGGFEEGSRPGTGVGVVGGSGGGVGGGGGGGGGGKKKKKGKK